MPTHKTGVWLNDDGDVVYEQPHGRSTQLIAKGGEITSTAKTRLAALGVTLTDDGQSETADKPDDNDETVDAVTTDDVKPKGRRAG